MKNVRWVLQGRIRVEENLTEPANDPFVEELSIVDENDEALVVSTTSAYKTRNLSGVFVELHASILRKGGWKRWATGRTKDDGTFLLSRSASGKKRRFKVTVHLADSRLRIAVVKIKPGPPIKPTLYTPPIIVLKDARMRSDPAVYFGDMVISDRPPIKQASRNHARRAAIWYALRTLQDALRDRDPWPDDPWLDFNKRLTVVYPAMTMTWAESNKAHITPKSYKIGTVIHESMHIWNYQHNHGTANWPGGWFFDEHNRIGTHNRQENANIAFHEGFASWASAVLRHELWGLAHQLPYNKNWLFNEHGITSMSALERNDDGVTSALRLLTAPDPYRVRFGAPDQPPEGKTTYALYISREERGRYYCPNPRLDVWDLLVAFRADATAGWRRDWEVGRDSHGFRRFFQRLSDIYPARFTPAIKDQFLRALNPRRNEELLDSCRRLATSKRASDIRIRRKRR